MTPSFRDFFALIKNVFHPTNQDKALLNMLHIYNENYTEENFEHNILQNWLNRGIPRAVCMDIINANEKCMKNYVNQLDEENKKILIFALEEFEIDSNEKNIGARLESFIADIARVKAKLPVTADLRLIEEQDNDKIYGTRILFSQEKRCACCNTPISLSGKLTKNIYKNYHIVKCDPNKDNSFENLVAICSGVCYRDFLNNFDSSNTIDSLTEKKKQYIKNDKTLSSLDTNKIEQQIYQILKDLKENFAIYSTSPKESYDVQKIINKILPEELDTLNLIKSDCDVSFGYILKLFNNLETENNFTYYKIREQVHQSFLNLDKLGLSQSEIFHRLTSWLLSESKLGDYYRAAGQKIISFFVQICEVFYEIPK